MLPLAILSIVGLIVAFILAIVVWTIVFIQYKELKKQRKIDWLIKRISERAEDSGNESDGDTEELSTLVEMGNLDFWDANNL
ncbi:vpu protein [Human immunodeficiency virus 1]|uniref:Protein Vpu n=1 Tax=Human immunodeficiency virus type 1 TaxID=11676 RepID=D2XL01_HV1|nr:vpu protein [Human immunodeficiency virus 1]